LIIGASLDVGRLVLGALGALHSTNLVSLAAATIATHLDCIFDGDLLARDILALAVGGINFRARHDSADQSGNRSGNEKCLLSFVHNFIGNNLIATLVAGSTGIRHPKSPLVQVNLYHLIYTPTGYIVI
jgi:hypothetical protein